MRDLTIEVARARWKARFAERVRLMKTLLDRSPEDTTPTPRGEGGL